MAKVPPLHNQEAEEAVVGALLIDPSQIAYVLPILGTTHEKFFTRAGHVYEAIVELDAGKEGIDLITLTDRLDKKPSPIKTENMLSYVGGAAYLTGTIASGGFAFNAPAYARAVRDAYTSRRVLDVSARAASLVYQHRDDPAYVLDAVEKAIFDIRTDRPSEVRSTRDLGLQFQAQMQHRLEHPDWKPGFKTRLIGLDHLLELERNRLVTIAGRPGLGKTNVATYLAWELVRNQKPTLFFSLEMSSMQMMHRLISLVTGVNGDLLKNPGKLDGRMADVQQFLGEFIDNKYPLFLAFGAKNVMEIRAHARRVNSQALTDYGEPLAAVIVDYIQLVGKTPGSSAERRDLEVGEISRTLKLMSLEDDLNCLVIEISQLSRAVESRSEKRPILSDLRDSGSLEQDSDIVIFTFPPLAYEPEDKRKRTLRDYQAGWEPYELIVAKNRDGSTGTAKAQWKKDCGQLRSA
jgi:replicative DNA helicase